MIKTVNAVVMKGQAYIPVNARTDAGVYLQIEPVFVAPLTTDGLVEAFQKVIDKGHPTVKHPTQEEFKNRRGPLLAATGVKSWNALAKVGAPYAITWEPDVVILYLPEWDDQGRFASGSGPHMTFPRNTPLLTVVEAMLADVNTRPHLLTKS